MGNIRLHYKFEGMKKLFFTLFLMAFACLAYADKEHYIPTEWSSATDSLLYSETDTSNEYTWSESRSRETDNVIVYWDNNYGTYAPDKITKSNGFSTTDSANYYVDIDYLLEKAEEFYRMETDTLQFVDPDSSNLAKYKVMILMHHNTSWICTGGGYDYKVSALWLSPSTCRPVGQSVAHEVGHSFHYMCYGEDSNYGEESGVETGFHSAIGSGQTIWETTANWQSVQSYPDQIFSQSNFVFTNSHNYAMSHEWQRYQSYWFLVYLCQYYDDITTVAQVWNQHEEDVKDFNEVLMDLKGLTVAELYELYFDYACHVATYDFDVAEAYRDDYIGDFNYDCVKLDGDTFQVAYSSVPQSTGFNIIPLEVPDGGTTVTVTFTALEAACDLASGDPAYYLDAGSSFSSSGCTSYNPAQNASTRGFRLGFVALMNDGTRNYYNDGLVHCTGSDEATDYVSFTAPENIKSLYFVVSPALTKYIQHQWDEDFTDDDQWPYRFHVSGSSLLKSSADVEVYSSTGVSATDSVTDVTDSYVKNATFSGNKTVWNIVTNMSSSSQSNNCQEFYNGSISDAYFKMSQTLYGLPDGIYRLTMNGFTRAGGQSHSQTGIYADTDEKEWMTPIWLRHADESYGSEPNTMSTASTAFYSSDGDYWLNTIDNIIVRNGKLVIGARNYGQLATGTTSGTWTILGNVKLYSLSGSSIKDLMDEVINEADSLNKIISSNTLASAISTASAIDADDLLPEDVFALQDAISDYKHGTLSDASSSSGVDASFLIQNAGFEDGCAFVAGSSNGNYNEPFGWTLVYDVDYATNNNCGTASEDITQAGYASTITPTEGNYAYSSRMRWTTNSFLTLTQDVTLPAGTYKLTTDFGHLGQSATAPTLTLTDASNNSLGSVTASATLPTTTDAISFTLSEAQDITLCFESAQSGQTDTRMVIDNIALTYYGIDDTSLTGATQSESRSTILNSPISRFIYGYNNRLMQSDKWEELATAVTEAEKLKDDTTATLTNVEAAATRLEAAMDSADASIEAYERLNVLYAALKDSLESYSDAADILSSADSALTYLSKTTAQVNSIISNLTLSYINRQIELAEEYEVDLTALLSNPSFEEGQTAWGNNFYKVYQPDGWIVDFLTDTEGISQGYRHMEVVPYGETHDGQAASMPADDAGTNYLYLRSNWGAVHILRAKQTVSLPEGRYQISAYVNHYSGTMFHDYNYILYDGNEYSLTPSETNSWEQFTYTFTLDEPKDITVSFGFQTEGESGTNNNSVKVFADNVQLTMLAPDYIEEYLKQLKLAKSYLETIQEHGLFANIETKLTTAINQDVSAFTEEVFIAATDSLIEANKWGRSAAAINAETGDASGVILNAEASDGTNNWTSSYMETKISQSYTGGANDRYFDTISEVWSSNGDWTAFLKQTLYLPAGYYSLSAIGRGESDVTLTMSVDDETVTFKSSSDEGGEIYIYSADTDSAATANSNKGYGWNCATLGFHLDNDTECTLLVKATAGSSYSQWCSIDKFSLTYANTAGTITDSTHLAPSGAVYASQIEQLIDDETRSIDLRSASVIVGTLDYPDTMNPNALIYANLGQTGRVTNVVKNNICDSLILTDKEPFHTPEAFTAHNATYNRIAYQDGLFESITMPFTATNPNDNFKFFTIGTEYDDYISLNDYTDSLYVGDSYLFYYTGDTSDETTTIPFEQADRGISIFEEPTEENLFGSTDIFTVESINECIYMLSTSEENEGKFVLAEGGSWLYPFRACYKGSTTAQTSLRLVYGNETAVSTVRTDDNNAPVNVYDLSGRLVKVQADPDNATDNLRQGIYIINNKKVIVK